MAGTSDKIFVGALPQTCTEDAFRAYFEAFGTITDAVIMKDNQTGNSRGFGFITFDNTASVDAVIDRASEHKIEDKWIDCKRAMPKGQAPPPKSAGKSGGKGCGASGGGGGGSGRPGDWVCASCGASVFASKESCFKCGAPKPAGGCAPGGCGGCGAYGGGNMGMAPQGYGGAYPPQGYGAPYGGYAYGGYPGYPPQNYSQAPMYPQQQQQPAYGCGQAYGMPPQGKGYSPY
eukprot:TRINITY_DN13326_c0_g4_i1.p1 TRINITY_DN13326_c0_g4~~TRINITY_DN13326_c0_g4_i1.p1  ORF type:complete len:232 (-),score=35.62 TRINITY_DN13326_c0_g4_i1:239-934(-)